MNTMEIGNIRITWLGHASFRIIDGEKVIYIDPHVLDENPPKADLILMTHDHGDHCDVEKAYKLLKDDTTVVASEICAGAFENATVASEGMKINVKGIGIEVVPAYNLKIETHPRGEGFGYLVIVKGIRIFHAGDTDFIPEMKEIQTDVALLPVGGTFVMDIDDAVNAALAIKPKIAIPMHYNFLENMKRDPYQFRRKVKERSSAIEVRVLEL